MDFFCTQVFVLTQSNCQSNSIRMNYPSPDPITYCSLDTIGCAWLFVANWIYIKPLKSMGRAPYEYYHQNYFRIMWHAGRIVYVYMHIEAISWKQPSNIFSIRKMGCFPCSVKYFKVANYHFYQIVWCMWFGPYITKLIYMINTVRVIR